MDPLEKRRCSFGNHHFSGETLLVFTGVDMKYS